MSNEELPAGYGAVNLAEVGKGAAADLKKFAKDMVNAIGNSGASQANQTEAKNALQKVLSEVSTKPLEGAHSSAAKGAAVKHTDSVKANQAAEAQSLQVAGNVAGLVAAATGNPMAKAIAEEFSPDQLKIERSKNFAELKTAAEKCGIKNIGQPPVPMESACNKAQTDVETIEAIKSLRRNGFNGDTIYGTHEQLKAGGNGQDGVRAFVVDCADRLAKQRAGKNPNDKLEFLERPKPVTAAMRATAASQGDKLDNGIRPTQAEKYTAAMASNAILGNVMLDTNAVIAAVPNLEAVDPNNDDPADTAMGTGRPVRRSKRNAAMILPGQMPMPGQSFTPGFVPNH